MECIILKAKEIEGTVFDLSDFAEQMNQLPDPRDPRERVYELGSAVVIMVVLARLSGQDKPYGIFEWIRARKEQFVRLFDLKRKQTSCLNTIRTILPRL